jgi:hypothetical protein
MSQLTTELPPVRPNPSLNTDTPCAALGPATVRRLACFISSHQKEGLCDLPMYCPSPFFLPDVRPCSHKMS